MRVTLLERLQNIPQIILFYLKTFFFPKDLAIAQHWLIDSITIKVIEPAVWAPAAFTPNNDGINDIFYVRGNADALEKFEFTIYNRAGDKIFYSKALNTGWDGTNIKTQKPLPAGAYVYIVKGNKLNGETINQNGIVNLIR